MDAGHKAHNIFAIHICKSACKYSVYLQCVQSLLKGWRADVSLDEIFRRTDSQRVINVDAVFRVRHFVIAAVVEKYQLFFCSRHANEHEKKRRKKHVD